MIKRFHIVSAAVAAGVLIAAVAEAHHSFAMFDRNTEIVKSGTVVRWAFNNPHSWLYLNVKGEDGKETLWSFEGSAPTGLIQRGITGDTFKPGDNVTFMYCPLRDGRPGRRDRLGAARRRQLPEPRRRRLQRQRGESEEVDGVAREGLHVEQGRRSRGRSADAVIWRSAPAAQCRRASAYFEKTPVTSNRCATSSSSSTRLRPLTFASYSA